MLKGFLEAYYASRNTYDRCCRNHTSACSSKSKHVETCFNHTKTIEMILTGDFRLYQPSNFPKNEEFNRLLNLTMTIIPAAGGWSKYSFVYHAGLHSIGIAYFLLFFTAMWLDHDNKLFCLLKLEVTAQQHQVYQACWFDSLRSRLDNFQASDSAAPIPYWNTCETDFQILNRPSG